MNFDEKTDFMIGNIETFEDPFDPPTTAKIHEKVVSKSKRITEEQGYHAPLILVHTINGLIPTIIDFPNSDIEKDGYCQEIKKLLATFEAQGYSLILEGWSVDYNEKGHADLFSETRPSLHPNRQEILQIVTEDAYNFRRTSAFKIIKRKIKGKKKTKLIQREDFEEFDGRLSGLLERKTKH